ncbi:MAG: hypothetical protein CMG00_09455 [Candidatus Marinimicrobia bacterium]|nr:hypothetical protein [Candidatus Neomarinimicrobiota bacterium]|tara:strand:- start:386 stop:1129 length:744 start_codon:yes stop_codon:yes gene_type:complete
MRNLLIRLSNLFHPSISKFIRGLMVFLRSRHLLSAWKIYTLSDELNKYQHITEAINYLRIAGANNRLPYTYFEFGCHSGRTFSAAMNAANYLKMEECEFHAFDSFGGLPETSDDDGYFEAGTFNTSETDFIKIIKRRTGKNLPSSSIHKGFYSDSLTEDLQKSLPKAGVIYVDVDLYSSTIELFEFMEPLLCDGSVVLFDDWYCFPFGTEGGEGLAMKEFLEKNSDFELIPWKTYSTFGQSFFIKIK